MKPKVRIVIEKNQQKGGKILLHDPQSGRTIPCGSENARELEKAINNIKGTATRAGNDVEVLDRG
jgi:hypothetical protein